MSRDVLLQADQNMHALQGGFACGVLVGVLVLVKPTLPFFSKMFSSLSLAAARSSVFLAWNCSSDLIWFCT